MDKPPDWTKWVLLVYNFFLFYFKQKNYAFEAKEVNLEQFGAIEVLKLLGSRWVEHAM